MRRLSSLEILDVWERGKAASSVQRAMLILVKALQDRSFEDLSRMHIGERDALLLDLYEMAFGPMLECETTCPGCSEKLELNMRTNELRAPNPNLFQISAKLCLDGYDVSFRLPNSYDLNAASFCTDLASAKQVLIERCILKVHKDGKDYRASELPDAVIDAISGRMEEMDPQANIQIGLICPSCRLRWSIPFDVLPLLWSEVDAWAKRTLREVHLLASTYGWSETEILEISRLRRQAYLGMIGS
jgi:hypothetical protein